MTLPPGRAKLSTKPRPTGSLPSRLQQRPHGRGAASKDDFGRERGQFRRVSVNFDGIAGAPTGVDPHVGGIGPAQLLQTLPESSDAGLPFRIVSGCGQEHADPAHRRGLLRKTGQRPNGRPKAGDCEKVAAPHSMTSSARPRIDCGTAMPSAFAVFKLMTSSYLVGAWTGISAGFSPLSIRSI